MRLCIGGSPGVVSECDWIRSFGTEKPKGMGFSKSATIEQMGLDVIENPFR